jgi:hypothetical protein
MTERALRAGCGHFLGRIERAPISRFLPPPSAESPFFGPPVVVYTKKPKKHADFRSFALYIGFAIPYDLVANKDTRFCFKQT